MANETHHRDVNHTFAEMKSDDPNPFLQQFSQMANSNIIKEEQEDDIVQYEENLRPLSALAPRVMHQDEAQVEVSSTPAFQCLEEVDFI